MAATFDFFKIDTSLEEAGCLIVSLNNAEKRNRLDGRFWAELPSLVKYLDEESSAKVIVWMGDGQDFCTGLDLKSFFMEMLPIFQDKSAESRERLYQKVKQMQLGFNRIAASPKVHICAIHGWCIGAGLDMAAACDLRIASSDAKISLRETRMGIVADLGSLQRLPAIIGQGKTRLMAFTGRDVPAQTAMEWGLIDHLVTDSAKFKEEVQQFALEVAGNPSIVLRGVKHQLNFMKSNSEAAGLEHVAVWNSAFLDSSDFQEAIAAFMEKRPPKFN